MTEEQIEEYLEKKIEALKPEIRRRFVYNFSEYVEKTDFGKHVIMANCNRMFKPPLITFYTKVIKSAPDLSTKLMDELINHEVLHTFYGFEEKDVVPRQSNVDFYTHG